MSTTPSIARPSVPDAPSLREHLRAGTQGAHDALDACFADMFETPDPSLYRRFIAMNLGAHQAVEPILASSALARLTPPWRPGDRLDALRRDAQALGLTEGPAPGFPMAEPDLFEALGIAYVLEGSRLGAKFMLKGLRKAGGTDPSLPTRYLEASSDARPFADLLGTMSALPASPADSERAVRAAHETFRFFRELTLAHEKRTPAA